MNKIEKAREALKLIDEWAQAYPLSAFPVPDLKKAADVLRAADMTIDRISADSMRHVLTRVVDILSPVREVLASPVSGVEEQAEVVTVDWLVDMDYMSRYNAEQLALAKPNGLKIVEGE